jgi:hypothetical protein
VTWDFTTEGRDGPAIVNPASSGNLGALETVEVSHRTTDQCRIAFNTASVTVNGMQVKQLQKMLAKVAVSLSGREAKELSARVTIGPLG